MNWKTLLTVVLSLVTLTPVLRADDKTIVGAGATFPYPLYARWAQEYQKTTGVQLNYQSIGSGGGIAQIKAKTVDFGASDAPLTKAELDKAGLVQFPMTIGGVVPVVNLPGIAANQLKLSPQVLASIFMGKITKWNDAAIAADNAGLKLPATAITPVTRADGSGTTWIYTNYLAKVSPEFEKAVGNGKAVKWPAGVSGKGNEGVAAFVQKVVGGIGYVEYAYALENKMTSVQLKNKSGNYVSPTAEAFAAAASSADWAAAPGFCLVLTEQDGAKSWPITGASFILMHKAQANASHVAAVLAFFNWAYRSGQAISDDLHYVAIPRNVADLVESRWAADITADGKPVWSKK